MPLEHASFTTTVVHENLAMVCIGTIVLLFAGLDAPRMSGITYALIGPIQTVLGTIHGRRRTAIAAEMAADSLQAR